MTCPAASSDGPEGTDSPLVGGSTGLDRGRGRLGRETKGWILPDLRSLKGDCYTAAWLVFPVLRSGRFEPIRVAQLDSDNGRRTSLLAWQRWLENAATTSSLLGVKEVVVVVAVAGRQGLCRQHGGVNSSRAVNHGLSMLINGFVSTLAQIYFKLFYFVVFIINCIFILELSSLMLLSLYGRVRMVLCQSMHLMCLICSR